MRKESKEEPQMDTFMHQVAKGGAASHIHDTRARGVPVPSIQVLKHHIVGCDEF